MKDVGILAQSMSRWLPAYCREDDDAVAAIYVMAAAVYKWLHTPTQAAE